MVIFTCACDRAADWQSTNEMQCTLVELSRTQDSYDPVGSGWLVIDEVTSNLYSYSFDHVPILTCSDRDDVHTLGAIPVSQAIPYTIRYGSQGISIREGKGIKQVPHQVVG